MSTPTGDTTPDPTTPPDPATPPDPPTVAGAGSAPAAHPGYPQTGYSQPSSPYPPQAGSPQPYPPQAGYPQSYPPQAGYPLPYPPQIYPGYPAAGPAAGWPGQNPGQTAWQVPPPGKAPIAPWQPPNRGLPIGAVIAIAIVGVLLLGGLTVFSAVRGVQDVRTAADRVTGGAAPLPTDGTHLHKGSLVSYLMPAPADSKPWRTKPQDEVLDQSAAARVVDADDDVATLESFDFTNGHVRRWISSQGTIVSVTLLQFSGQGGAALYYNYLTLEYNGSWGVPNEVPGIRDAADYVKSGPDADGNQLEQGIAMTGDIVILVITDQKPTVGPGVNLAVLSTQYNRL